MKAISELQNQDGVLGQLLNANDEIIYLETEIFSRVAEMENWEEEEYQSNYNDLKKVIKELKEYIVNFEAFFNTILSPYNLSVATFIAKHIVIEFKR